MLGLRLSNPAISTPKKYISARKYHEHTGTVNHVVFNCAGKPLQAECRWAARHGTSQVLLFWTNDENAPKSALFREAYFVVFSPDERYVYFEAKIRASNAPP
ncbi:MAG: hypothetical protein IPL33_12880 [Sphingobacteriales bacterium]|nr:hypothetical protein [Sphingobacteriales bacterium]